MNNTSLSQWQNSQNEGGVTGANHTNTTANQDLIEVVSDQEMLINMLEEKLEELDAETLSRQAKEKQKMDKEDSEEGDGEDAPAVLTPAKAAEATPPVNQD